MAAILTFFGPYYPGTPFRIDQILGWALVGVVALGFFAGKLALSKQQRTVFVWSLLVLFIATVRLAIDHERFMEPGLQIANQFSYCAVGVSLWYVVRERFPGGSTIVVRTLLWISVIVNLYAISQFLFPESALVSAGFRYYGGVGDESYRFGDQDTIAAYSVLAGQRFTSIFSGMHSLGVFNLFMVAICLAKMSAAKTFGSRWFIGSVGILCVVGGLLSTSKVFVFGILVMLGIVAVVSQKRASVLAVLFSIVFFVAFAQLSPEIRVLDDIGRLVRRGDMGAVLESRYGRQGGEGYLSDVMDVTFEPFTLIFGLGGYAGDYKYSDSEFRQVILVAGLPLFLVFYGLLLYLLRLNWLARHKTPYGLPMFALGVAFLLAGLGIATHLQARTIPLWMLVNLLLAVPSRESLARAPMGHVAAGAPRRLARSLTWREPIVRRVLMREARPDPVTRDRCFDDHFSSVTAGEIFADYPSPEPSPCNVTPISGGVR